MKAVLKLLVRPAGLVEIEYDNAEVAKLAREIRELVCERLGADIVVDVLSPREHPGAEGGGFR